jgi:urocanate hydratase
MFPQTTAGSHEYLKRQGILPEGFKSLSTP